ncbi:MAG: Uma2 family endonuclease [Planctomycetaceae bacterium]
MSSAKLVLLPKPIIYPETDGEPIAENTKQYNAITTIKGNVEIQFAGDPLVLVAADLFWYPKEGDPTVRTAPDTLVVFGVPKGDRGSYKQWEENNLPPQVVFEVLSPGNRLGEMTRKFAFYNEWGVEEYYIFDPEDGSWDGWIRRDGQLRPVPVMAGWISPRLGIRFELGQDQELWLFRADGQRFLTMLQLETRRCEAEERSELDLRAREQAQQRADLQQQRADQQQQRAELAERRIAQLTAKLQEAGIDLSTES